jgi:hypothetical protein
MGTDGNVGNPCQGSCRAQPVLVRVADIVVAVDFDWGVRTRLINKAWAAKREAV